MLFKYIYEIYYLSSKNNLSLLLKTLENWIFFKHEGSPFQIFGPLKNTEFWDTQVLSFGRWKFDDPRVLCVYARRY